jgi:hypothetical protein
MRSVDHGKLRGKFLTVSNPGTEPRRRGVTLAGKPLTKQKRSLSVRDIRRRFEAEAP